MIDALPPDYRTALVLSDVEGLTYADIAQVLGIPSGTVRSRIFRARRRAQAELYRYAAEMGYVKAQGLAAPKGTTCLADRELLFDLLKHELTADVAGEIHKHLLVCCDCDACARFQRSYLAIVRTALERQRCPEGVRQAILGVLGSEQAQ